MTTSAPKTEEEMESHPTSTVFEITKDLVETEGDTCGDVVKGSSIDWSLGGDDDNASCADSDATAEMTSDDEDDENVDTVDEAASDTEGQSAEVNANHVPADTEEPQTDPSTLSSQDDTAVKDETGQETDNQDSSSDVDFPTNEDDSEEEKEDILDDSDDKEDDKVAAASSEDELIGPSEEQPEEENSPETRPSMEEKAEEGDDASVVKKEEKKPDKANQPDVEDLFRSTDFLFIHADKDSVTVADVCRALQAEYDCKLSKPNRKLVRSHLVDLMSGKIEPSVDTAPGDDPSTHPSDDEESAVGQDDDSDHEPNEASEEEASDYEDENPKKNTKKRRKNEKPIRKKISKPKPPSRRKAAKAARMIEAQRLRKKRMEELRVRNEEMQLDQSREEKERAAKIAARLETDTDELRVKRLEDRLNLLQALDKKRIEVVEIKDDEPNTEPTPQKEETKIEESESEEESSDEEDLEIVGIAKPIRPMAPIHTHFRSKAMDLLKKLKSPDAKQRKATKVAISPGTKNMNARSALRHRLKQKQRIAGNLWLARELGYKTEKEHLKDCQTAAHHKREQVVKVEQLRLKANERKHLRERLLLDDGEPQGQGEEEQVKSDDTPEGEEENEELLLAREIESEKDQDSSIMPHTETTVADEETTQVTAEETEIVGSEDAEPDNDCQESFVESQGWETQPPLEPTVLPKEVEPRTTAAASTMETQPLPEAEALPTGVEPSTSVAESTLETQPHLDARALPTEEEPRSTAAESALETQPPLEAPAIPMVHAPRIVSSESTGEAPAATSDQHELNEEISSVKVDSANPEEPDEELEFVNDANSRSEEAEGTNARDPKRPRNAGWQAMLKKEAEKLKKQKKRKKAGDLVEAEAEEEEEEEVAGLEDFGFSSAKKKGEDGDEDENANDELDEEDLKHVVDDLSDDEGDEEEGRKARKRQEQREEKERHKEMLRRMREGYDGRRGGIAGGGGGARGVHRFDQLVAADNREDAKRLGLLNDDEMDSDDDEKPNSGDKDDEEDETALLDKMLKDRFLHRSNVELDENFSDDEEEDPDVADNEKGQQSDDEEDRTQERLAKRFAKRARMHRLEEMYSESQEFSRQRLIDEDESMKSELQAMKNGLVRRRSFSSSRSSFSDQGSNLQLKRQRSSGSFGGTFLDKGASLSIALKASRKTKQRTSFLGGPRAGNSKEPGGLVHKSISLSHVVFQKCDSRSMNQSRSNLIRGGSVTGKRKERPGASSSLFGKVSGRGQ